MKKKILKTRKVKKFSLSLTCIVMSEREFSDNSREFYNFVSCSLIPRRVDIGYNSRSFYLLDSFRSLKARGHNISFESYTDLPRCVCVERVLI